MKVRGRVLEPEAEGAPWRLQIELAGSDAREIQGESCDALVGAAAVMVAISLSSRGHAAVPEPPPPEPAELEATDAEPSDVEAVDAAGPEPTIARSDPLPARRWGPARALLGVTVALHGAGLPSLGAGLGGRVGVLWGPLRVAAYGAHWFRRERAVVDDVAAAYQLGVGGLELCGVLGLGTAPAGFELLGCGEAEVGLLRAEGVRAESSNTQRRAWWAMGGGVGAAWTPRSFVALGLRADVLAPLNRFRFTIGSRPAGTIGPVDARGAVFVEFRLPSTDAGTRR
jgi:hypothetical protein